MDSRTWTLFAAVTLGAALSVAGARAESVPNLNKTPIVETTKGKVQGFIRNGVLEFRGIPYGASTAGERRWTLPQEPQAWADVLPTMHFKPACAQAARYNLTERSDSEDCLHLNVSRPYSGAPIAADKRPVIFWIHGGAFIGGSSSLYRLDRLARQTGAVIVSANYRLGVFGFMPHPSFEADHNGGYALEDQRLALRWVKRNIAAFGGDPENVTLAGESAGGASVCMHLITPEATTGLFHKAIVQSAACVFQLRNAKDRNSFGEAVAKKAGCDNPAMALTCMRGKDAQELIAAADAVSAGDLMAMAPVYGTKTLPRPGREALETGNFVKVPILNGGTRNELRLYVAYDVQAGKSYTAENLPEVLKALYGQNGEAVAKEYPVSGFSSAPAALGSIMSDFRPDIGINHCMSLDSTKLLSRHVPVYHMDFADPKVPVLGAAMPLQPDPKFELGPVHSSELIYYFPHFSNTTQMSAPDLPPASQALADRMVASWSNFIRTGVPQARAIPKWELYVKKGLAMRFEPGKTALFNPAREYRCAFWKKLYPDGFSR
ncbi:MAG: carboxylesterase family protein [Bradyrhizobium sp.]|uniref:carboxylesterase/lipase family protein n=1 Tax=Bradyrhizobium sp. TaxID=376 RepID=UPI0025BDBAAE|nr:carboxylesterase family protein [Bradyrhizobium sp.]MBI5261547.1 carboxylesterase family protein [Bradyrhizobium sp.]